jgi:hypothetical protein
MSDKRFLNDYENTIKLFLRNEPVRETNKTIEANNQINVIQSSQSQNSEIIQNGNTLKAEQKEIKSLNCTVKNKIETEKNPVIENDNMNGMMEEISSGLFQEYDNVYIQDKDNELRNSFDAFENENIINNLESNSAIYNNNSLRGDNSIIYQTSNNVINSSNFQDSLEQEAYNNTKTIFIGKRFKS